ncbi:MAG TPA: pantetheine-phosphate adenylyltransferase [Candidatus Acidoferrum sp.]|nr:pantetheine-phosphate adenylyltransferase [Candidatus Acidoferrum sp.]
MKTSIAIYPGSFDPVTNGHLDLIERGEKMFDKLIVAVLKNVEKQPLFTVAERVEMLKEVTEQWDSVEIDVFEGLLVDYARKRGAAVILRGIRAISDYEFELQMALMNRKLEPRLETVFMLPSEAYSYLSAKLVREIAQWNGPLTGLVPQVVELRLRKKLS